MLLFVPYDTNDKAAPLMHMSQHAATEHLRGRWPERSEGWAGSDGSATPRRPGATELLPYANALTPSVSGFAADTFP